MTMKMKVGAIILASTLALTGCASGAEGGSEAKEQSLIVAPLMFPAALDFTKYAAEDGVLQASEQVFDTLVTTVDGGYEPRLAESWENPDPLTWVINLREGVTFSDGTEFTSADVAATIQRHLDVQSLLAPLLSSVTNSDTTDPNTLVLTTDVPLGNLLGTFSMMYIAQGSALNDDAYWQKPVGTGAFKIDEFVPDNFIKMSRNDSYWGTPAVLDTIEYRDIPEASARITALETGEIDVTTAVAPDQVDLVAGADGVTLDSVESLTYWLGWFNNERAPFTDVRVRQALWHAMNLEETVPALYGDTASIGRAPVAASAFGASEFEPYEYDVDLAKSLLADAGFPNGFETTISYPIDAGPNVRQLAQAIISDLAAVGVKVTAVESERANWLPDLMALNWDMQIFTNTTATGDADYTLGRLYKSSAKRLGFANAEVDQWLAEAVASVDQEERAELYRKVSEHLWDNAVGFYPAQMKINIAYRDDVIGVELPATGRVSFAEVSRG